MSFLCRAPSDEEIKLATIIERLVVGLTKLNAHHRDEHHGDNRQQMPEDLAVIIGFRAYGEYLALASRLDGLRDKVSVLTRNESWALEPMDAANQLQLEVLRLQRLHAQPVWNSDAPS